MWRLRLLLILFLWWFFLIIVRLFQWQVLSHEELSRIASDQHLTTYEVEALRGEILSTDGSPLVSNQPSYLIFVEPQKLTDKDRVITELSGALEVDEASISARLEGELLWVPIKHRVNREIVDSIKGLNLDGVGWLDSSMRFYPEGSMSAHLTGFVGSSWDGSPRGYFGLEGYYDRKLRGRSGFFQQAKSASGNPILAGIIQRILPEDGRSLKLHLDKRIQYLVENKLLSGITRYGAQGGSVVVVNPKNGGIIAMASYPSYDPDNYHQFSEDIYKNPAVALDFEPGSIFKVITMASAIDEGVVSKETIFEEEGPLLIDGHRIRTWNDQYAGLITATEILERSSNVGIIQVGQLIGRERFISYIKKFGFGQATKIDLEEEVVPELRPEKNWSDIDLATASFGQGISVTPIQMVQAVSAIANGGRLFQPQVVDKLVTPSGEVIDIKPKLLREVIRPASARFLTEMMVKAVDNGEASFAKPKGYRIAGKTGTAQIPIAGHYDTEKTIASFVGFAPADDPRFVMLVTLKEPSASPWGSETAAPLFFDIAQDLFTYYGIPPSE